MPHLLSVYLPLCVFFGFVIWFNVIIILGLRDVRFVLSNRVASNCLCVRANQFEGMPHPIDIFFGEES